MSGEREAAEGEVDPGRKQAFDDVTQEHADVQGEIEQTIPDLFRRLDALSDEMRRRGAFPVASQIDRRRADRAR